MVGEARKVAGAGNWEMRDWGCEGMCMMDAVDVFRRG